jgi:hypothetical protein
MTETRSPIKEPPLRTPGQSLDEEIAKLRTGDFSYYVTLICTMACVIAYEWACWITKIRPEPYLLSLGGVGVIGYCIFRIRRLDKRIAQLELGREGERIVAEYLDELKKEGSVVFHDIVGSGFNIDHVIVSRHGVVTIETKTRSKIGPETVTYDGKCITVDHRSPDQHSIVQAKAEAHWLRSMLKESTGKDYPVRPAVVFLGWFVEGDLGSKASSVWVLNPKMLPGYIGHEPKTVSEEDMRLAAYHLSRYIRAGERVAARSP